MKIDRDIYKELKYISKLESCQERLVEYLKDLKPVSYRTLPQNSALHLDCKLISDKLNDAGLDMKKVITVDIPFEMKSVKKHLWKPVMELTTGKTSTTKLDKTSGEIEKIHDIIMRTLGEKWGIEYHPFPSDDNK